MELEEKVRIFDKELNFIINDEIRDCVIKVLDKVNDKFFTEPASSTGKYHPDYALGEGGLVRHTKSAVRIAYELLEDPAIGNKYTQDEKDLMIISLMLHDGLKLGKEQSKYTKFDHPLLVAIASHMGPWTKDYDGNEVLPYPKTKYQNFVHMCDYLSSKKFLNVEFDDNNNIVE